MWLYLLFFVMLVVGAITLWYAMRCLKMEREDQKQQFRRTLTTTLKETPLDQFDFTRFVEQADVPLSLANEVAADSYARVFVRALADLKITSKEAAQLDSLARALRMDSSRRTAIENTIKQGEYRGRLDAALADGKITEDEAEHLEELRSNLGL